MAIIVELKSNAKYKYKSLTKSLLMMRRFIARAASSHCAPMSSTRHLYMNPPIKEAIGIDLGSFSSRAAIMLQRDSKPEMVLMGMGTSTVLPSFVYLPEDEQEALTGYEAMQQAASHPSTTFYGMKRFAGRKHLDPIVAECKQNFPFPIDVDTNGVACVRRKLPMHSKSSSEVSSEHLLTLLLKEIKRLAEVQRGNEIYGALLTIPGHFDDDQRMSLKRAGVAAGFQVFRIIREDYAVLMSLNGFARYKDGQRLVIVNCGDELTVSTFEIVYGFPDVLATTSVDFEYGADLRIAEKSRCELLISECAKCLKNAKVEPTEVAEIHMVGCGARVPSLRKALADFFEKDPLVDECPEDTIAKGAVVMLSQLTCGRDLLTCIGSDTTSPVTYGVESADGTFVRVIERGEKTPVKKSIILPLSSLNQTKACVRIYAGELSQASKNHWMLELHIKDIKREPRPGPIMIEITLEIDIDCNLNVTVAGTADSNDTVSTHMSAYGSLRAPDFDRLVSEGEGEQTTNVNASKNTTRALPAERFLAQPSVHADLSN